MNTKPANRSLIVLGTIICQMGTGTIYTRSLFNQPLVDKFHWGLADVATTFSITSFFPAFATLFAGKLQERFGIRNLTLCSGIPVGGPDRQRPRQLARHDLPAGRRGGGLCGRYRLYLHPVQPD